MSDSAAAHENTVLDSRYVLLKKIASGGMATVWLANDTRLNRTVAVKIIYSQLAEGPHREQFLHRFRLEAQSAAAIANSHIVQVYDTGESDGLDYLVMEYVRGIDLRQKLRQEGTLSVRNTIRILSEILDGLASAHQANLVHRDIKPENILLNSRGRVEITDFGLAKVVSEATIATTGIPLGTAAYLAPETIESNVSTFRSDLYSVGIMGYEMLVGQAPFLSANPVTMIFRHVNSDVPSILAADPNFPAPVAAFITRLTARNPEQRPQDAGQAYAELTRVLAQLSSEDLAMRHIPTSPSTAAAQPAANPLQPPAPAMHGTTPMPALNGAQATQATRIINQPGAGASFDQPTQPLLMNSAPTTALPGAAGTQNAKSAQAKQNAQAAAKKSSAKKWAIGSVCALLLAAGAGAGWWAFLGPGSYVDIPLPTGNACSRAPAQSCAIKGATWSAYEVQLKKAGIPYTVGYAYSNAVVKGEVVSTNPDQGGHISKYGGKLAVTVSKGPKMVTIPENLLDCSQYPHAKSYLTSLGMNRVSQTEEYSLTVDAGCVVSSSIAPGTRTAANTPLKLVISKGLKPVQIPPLTGLQKDEALKQLNELKLKVTVKEDYSDSVPQGQIISSSPSSGANAHWGDAITITVSKGPQTVTMPNLIGKSESEAESQLKQLGLTARTQASGIGERLHIVFGQSVTAGTQVRLRDSSGNPTVVTLTIV